jgi:type I restriction enzyme S subunit
MGSEWPTVPLGELVEMSADKIETKSIPAKCYVSTDSMLPDFGGVSFNRATPSVAKTSSFSKDDILFSNIRTHFRKLWIADRNGGCSNDVIVFRSKENVHPRFMFYSMMDERFIQHTVQTSKGTKMPRGDKSAIIQYNTVLPPLPEQKSIAHILGTLDDKIELNRRMNATLEEMAQALFKSWFADFDPVIDNALAAGNPIPDELAARAEVRRQALANGTANREAAKAFPYSFQDTEELGWIPEGWDVKQVKDFGSVVCGKTPSKSNSDYYGDDVPFIKIPDMHDSAWITNTNDGLSFAGANSQAKKQIPAKSIAVSCIATVGKVVITSQSSHTNQQINSLIPHREEFRYYLYFAFLAKNKELHDLASGGSATLNLNTGSFSKIEMLSPSKEALEAYHDATDPLFKKMLASDIESQSLTKLRDTLLPKLISGELRIPEAKQLIEKTLDV